MIYILLIIIIILGIKPLYKKIRGILGEYNVSKKLKTLSNDYIVLNNIMLKNKKSTNQIDHIVISKYGIFVIETKNFYGKIFGAEFNKVWYQFIYKNKYLFYNPIRQNKTHIKALEKLLKLSDANFISIICFNDDADISKVTTNTHVTNLKKLIPLIHRYHYVNRNIDIKKIKKIIKKNNNINPIARMLHVINIKTRYLWK